tara:strand:- start:696 stop:2009 length:1314 start_codon:yes stop_codon:yes gene_type:complete
MRLLQRLQDDVFELTSFEESPPPYAILSHTWAEGQEVTYNELVAGAGRNKKGYAKLRFCGRQAADDGLQYFWVDTCCIDKSTSYELSTAINSMFCWYQRASKCYVYLSDVSVPQDVNVQAFRITWAEAFRRSQWFTRGWTLQELLAPPYVEFFSREGRRLGSRISLAQEIHQISTIPIEVLRGQSITEYSFEERMRWTASRTTTLIEDKVYCLLGIFGVFLPIIYGEGEEYATRRLDQELQKAAYSHDISKSHTAQEAMESADGQYNNDSNMDLVHIHDMTDGDSQPSSPSHSFVQEALTIPTTASHTHGFSNNIWSSTGKGSEVITGATDHTTQDSALEPPNEARRTASPELSIARTFYAPSATLTTPARGDKGYIGELAEQLFGVVNCPGLTRDALDRVSQSLPDLLRAFAVKVGYQAPSPMHRDVMFYVRKERM